MYRLVPNQQGKSNSANRDIKLNMRNYMNDADGSCFSDNLSYFPVKL